MPIYEFQCDQCGHRFDKLMSMKDPTPSCPNCSGADVKKRVSAAGFVLKGGGWYKDHYGLKSGSTSTSSDSKPETKTEAPKKDSKASVAA